MPALEASYLCASQVCAAKARTGGAEMGTGGPATKRVHSVVVSLRGTTQFTSMSKSYLVLPEVHSCTRGKLHGTERGQHVYRSLCVCRYVCVCSCVCRPSAHPTRPPALTPIPSYSPDRSHTCHTACRGAGPYQSRCRMYDEHTGLCMRAGPGRRHHALVLVRKC